MSYWIFKIIYWPIFFIVSMMSTVVIVEMLKETTWIAPYRWLCIIGFIAYFADRMVNK